MKKGKISKNVKKEEEKQIEESYSIKQLLTIIFIVLLVFVVFYFITTLVVKPNSNSNSNNSEAIIDSSNITLSNLLNRKEKEYYVLATKESLYSGYGSKMNYIEIYEKYIKDYSGELKFYRVYLDDALNKNFVGESSNIVDNLSELKVSDETLFKINNGKIESYYIGSEKIIEALSSLK